MGRPRKSIEQHKRDGTFQKCRHQGPELESNELPVPEDIKGAAAEAWQELAPILASMGILSEADSMAFRLLCDSYGLYLESCEHIAEHGAYYVAHITRAGIEQVKEHPASKARSRYWREVESMARQFGLTPSARTGLNVGTTKNDGPSELAMILRGGMN
ncbi:MAG: phage terminase small subunit P27 family [Planctomycetes bacterium]|nr:phage terminase small subunit P27 family [Planctomycetota bacterium]